MRWKVRSAANRNRPGRRADCVSASQRSRHRQRARRRGRLRVAASGIVAANGAGRRRAAVDFCLRRRRLARRHDRTDLITNQVAGEPADRAQPAGPVGGYRRSFVTRPAQRLRATTSGSRACRPRRAARQTPRQRSARARRRRASRAPLATAWRTSAGATSTPGATSTATSRGPIRRARAGRQPLRRPRRTQSNGRRSSCRECRPNGAIRSIHVAQSPRRAADYTDLSAERVTGVAARAPRTTSVTADRNASMVASGSSPMFDTWMCRSASSPLAR